MFILFVEKILMVGYTYYLAQEILLFSVLIIRKAISISSSEVVKAAQTRIILSSRGDMIYPIHILIKMLHEQFGRLGLDITYSTTTVTVEEVHQVGKRYHDHQNTFQLNYSKVMIRELSINYWHMGYFLQKTLGDIQQKYPQRGRKLLQRERFEDSYLLVPRDEAEGVYMSTHPRSLLSPSSPIAANPTSKKRPYKSGSRKKNGSCPICKGSLPLSRLEKDQNFEREDAIAIYQMERQQYLRSQRGKRQEEKRNGNKSIEDKDHTLNTKGIMEEQVNPQIILKAQQMF